MKPDRYAAYHRFYDLFSSAELFPSLSDFCQRIARFAPPDTTRIADIGAGTGLFTHLLQKQFREATFSVVEPSEHMMPYAKARLESSRTHYNQCRFEQIPAMPLQDVLVFQRSLYAFSGELEYFKQLAVPISRMLANGGLLAIYEIGQTYNIEQLHDYYYANRNVLALTAGRFNELWQQFEEILVSFNRGVEDGDYMLFDKARLADVFQAGFELLDTDERNIFLFRKSSDLI